MALTLLKNTAGADLGAASPPWNSLARATSKDSSHCAYTLARSASMQVCGKAASSAASSSASARAEPLGTTRLARPICNASSAFTGRPVRIRSSARPCPTIRGRRTLPPSISGTPKRRQNTPQMASSAITRRSASSASSSPPATA